MAETQAFELWLEFEQWEAQPDDDPRDDYANVIVWLPDGRKYAMNVWTFLYLHRARYPWSYEVGSGEPAEYVLPPDLFVERLDRPTIERVVSRMLAEGEMRAEWLCPPDEADSE